MVAFNTTCNVAHVPCRLINIPYNTQHQYSHHSCDFNIISIQHIASSITDPRCQSSIPYEPKPHPAHNETNQFNQVLIKKEENVNELNQIHIKKENVNEFNIADDENVDTIKCICGTVLPKTYSAIRKHRQFCPKDCLVLLLCIFLSLLM